MSKGSAPTPPNPIATAGAQTSSNVSTAVANAFLNDTNQVTPLGSLNYDPTSTYSFNDPSTGTTYNIPRFTATQSLTPQELAIQDQTQAAKFNLANLSASQSGRIGDILANPFTGAGAPGPADPNLLFSGQSPQTTFDYTDPLATSFTQAPDIQQYFDPAGTVVQDIAQRPDYLRNFGAAGDITKTYGPADDFSSDRSRVEQSLYGRLNPQLALEQQHIEQQLADQGIRYGSAAYTNAMDSYNRQANDARLAVTQTAGQEQQRMMDMAAQRAGFQNAAQQQEYQQQLGRGTFSNQAAAAQFAQAQAVAQFQNAAQQQQYQQALGRGQFYNQAQQQYYDQAAGRASFSNQALQNMFSQNLLRGQFANAGAAQQQSLAQQYNAAQNASRAQYLQEQYALRNQPLNEISGLLSGSQIAQPSFMQTPQNQIPTTDIAGLINTNFSQNFQNFQAQQAQQNAIIGGLFGLGAGALQGATLGGIIKSDRASKKSIHRVGTVFAATPHAVADVDADEAGGDNVKKLPIYRYAYKDDPASTQHIGPMAQDVEKIDPAAVRKIGGIKHIDTRRVMGSILRAA